MSVLKQLNNIVALSGFRVSRVRGNDTAEGLYNYDQLYTAHNHDFMHDPRFRAAYERGMQAAGGDYFWYWRVHVGIWAGRVASHLEGDFVECGVNRGFLSSAIMHDLDWNQREKSFYLLDTFAGLDETTADDKLKKFNKNMLESGFYVNGVDSVRQNFAEWNRVQIVVGAVPGTLEQVRSDRIAFLSLDMNHPAPEVASLEYFWPRLSPGAVVLMDDYGYLGYPDHKPALDALTSRLGVSIASLPTGQGLLIKPPTANT